MSKLVKILITILLTTCFAVGCGYGVGFLSNNLYLIDMMIIIIIVTLTLLGIFQIGRIIFEILDANF